MFGCLTIMKFASAPDLPEAPAVSIFPFRDTKQYIMFHFHQFAGAVAGKTTNC